MSAIKYSRQRKRESLPEHVPGQFIVRFKPAVVDYVAHHTLAGATSVGAMAAPMPEVVSGPLDFLQRETGLVTIRPLFVETATAPAPMRGRMTLASAKRALAASATKTPRKALSGFQLVEIKSKTLTSEAQKLLEASPAIQFVEPVPNRWVCSKVDPLVNRQWGLRAIRWFQGTRPNAGSVHVGVFDTGIDKGHDDLRAVVAEYRHDGNKTRDFFGHGTHVSGIIAAEIDNAIGIAGVANCRLHCWKIFDDPKHARDEGEFNFEVFSRALASALDSDIKVINLSIGGPGSSKTEAAAFRELADDGVVTVAAMGNEFEEGNPKEYPAGYAGVLAVGAVDEIERRAPFSCTGAHIGMVAPGVNILSTTPRQKSADADTTHYGSMQGTSMATPYVAGAAALLYVTRAKSKAAASAVVKRLKSSARKLPGMKKRSFTREYGSGLLDVCKALKRA
jgi:hypothetical protein